MNKQNKNSQMNEISRSTANVLAELFYLSIIIIVIAEFSAAFSTVIVVITVQVK